MFSPMNFLVKTYLRKWDKELYQISYHCAEVQKKELSLILNSPFVSYLHNGVGEVLSYSDFQEKFPITTYEDVKERILQLMNDSDITCAYFAQSAGTTSGEKKLIPTPESFVKRNHLRGSWYILHTLYKHDAKMSVFKSKNLLVGGSLYRKNKRHTIGDISGIMLNRIPLFFRPWYVPSIKTAVNPNWKNKITLTSEKAAKTSKITLLGGIPTWVLAVLRSVLEKSEKTRISDLWPHLKAYIHGGVNFEPYRSQFEELIKVENFRYIEVYNATEGFFAVQDRPKKPGMMLMCASGIFYEFIKYQDFINQRYDAIRIEEVKLQVDYVMVISTYSGLLRYVQGDLVKFVTISPFRILVTGRIKEFINAFGEDMMLQHVHKALTSCTSEKDIMIKDFTVAPYYITINEKGRHDWYIEFEKTPTDVDLFSRQLDQYVCEMNPNYAQKRSDNLAMESLKIHVLPSGTTERYFSIYGSVGGQSKLQKLRNDRLIADRLEELI